MEMLCAYPPRRRWRCFVRTHQEDDEECVSVVSMEMTLRRWWRVRFRRFYGDDLVTRDGGAFCIVTKETQGLKQCAVWIVGDEKPQKVDKCLRFYNLRGGTFWKERRKTNWVVGVVGRLSFQSIEPDEESCCFRRNERVDKSRRHESTVGLETKGKQTNRHQWEYCTLFTPRL